ncbi:MAG: diguanylate cyclase [Desulfonatronovibrio sp. MSAO_Bac4]|nr:MAG: diguanylate cyclase [Desulfonatronovibrio sp. MSAO_Bac4]
MDNNISREIIKPLRDCLKLVFPPVMPQLIREASKNTPDFGELSRIVSIDPGLTVTIMSLANSPYYGLSQRVTDLKRAMVVLGSSEILKLAIAATMKKSIYRKMGRCEHIEYQNWSVMLWSAMASELIARELKLPQADTVYVCALVKDLSLLLLCCSDDPRLKKYAGICKKEDQGLVLLRPHQLDEEEDVWGVNHTKLTMDLLSYWGFPETDCRMLSSHHDLENIHEYDKVEQALILGTYWSEVEMSEKSISQLFRVRSIAKNVLGLDEEVFERIRGVVSKRFKSMCTELGIHSGENNALYYDFPVARIQDLYFAAQELLDVHGDLYDVVRTVAKHLHWLWGMDDFEISLVSPLTGEHNIYTSSADKGLSARSVQKNQSDKSSKAGVLFFLKDHGYLTLQRSVAEETLAEMDLYTNFLSRTFESYFYRTLRTTSKARIMDFMPVAVARISIQGKILQVNKRFMDIFDLENELAGDDFWSLAKKLAYIESDRSWENFIPSGAKKFSKLFCPLEPRMEGKDVPCWHMTAHRVEMDGTPQILVMLEDVAEISTLEKDIIKQGEYLRGIIGSMQDIVFTVDETGEILFSSPALKNDLLGKNFFDISSPLSVLSVSWEPGVLSKINMPVEVNMFMNNSSKSLELIFNRLSCASSPQYLVVGRDLTAIRRLEEKIKKQAAFDHLTKVFNRHQFSIFLERETQRAMRTNQKLGLIFFDLDRFKEFNDKFGHQKGDEALKSFGRLLVDNSRRGMDYPFRFGGDEFVLLVTDTNGSKMEQLVRRLISSFEKDYDYDLSMSIGMAIMSDNESKKEFLDRADRALFKAKEINKNAFIWAKNT